MGGNSLSDCGVKDASQSDCNTLLSLSSTWSGLWLSLTGTTYCGWVGIGCSAGRVTNLTLTGRSLSGSLPAAVGSLSALKQLGLGSAAPTPPTTKLTTRNHHAQLSLCSSFTSSRLPVL